MYTGFVQIEKNILDNSRWMSGLRILISAYLRINMSVSAHIITCIDWLATGLGFKVNHRAGKICDRIRTVLSDMKDDGTIITDADIALTGWNSPIRLALDLTNSSYNPRDAPFVILTEEELNTIVSSSSSAKEKLVTVYLHIKKRIYVGDADDPASSYCWPSLATIARDASNNVKISQSTASVVIDELVNIGLLKQHVTGSYEVRPGVIKAAPNVYCLGNHNMDHCFCNDLMKNVIWDHEHIKINNFIESGTGLQKKKG